MGNSLKKFVGEAAYNIIQNTAVDGEKLRSALITPQNARAVFADLTPFEIKSLCAEISNAGEIGIIRKTNQEEIKAAFRKAGYVEVIFDDADKIKDAGKYYASGETICTYNNLDGRMREYHMLVAIKSDIEKIKRADNPQREDDYGTSIINIQIARNGSHMSIKNRYNHTVSNPDATYNNNLDMVTPGLQSMVLGYYGFASLNREKSSYNSVIKIGGVYLKWHTEYDNKYYGAFVLGADGASYTDTSRYYVAPCVGGMRYRAAPLVLDFQRKEAAEKTITKATIVGRALKEGLLSSANKDEADTITATFADAKQELLQTNRKALKFAAEVFGYDFQKPFTVSAVMGRWTARSIEKAFNVADALMLVCDGTDLKTVKLSGGKFCAKDIGGRPSYKVSAFYGQGDFEEVRKNGRSVAFIINQGKEYRREIKEAERSYGYCRKPDEYDKCGNNLTEVRRQLNGRLNAYKTAKRLREAASRDYAAEVAEIKSRFTELKTEIISALINAETPDDYRKVCDAQDFRLPWMVRDIQAIEKHAEAKDFSSVQAATSAINNVLETISKIKAKLAA